MRTDSARVGSARPHSERAGDSKAVPTTLVTSALVGATSGFAHSSPRVGPSLGGDRLTVDSASPAALLGPASFAVPLTTRAGRVLALASTPPAPSDQRIAFIVELGALPARNPVLEWSWNREDWDDSGKLKPGCGQRIALRRLPNGEYGAPVDLSRDLHGREVFWDVKADIPKGEGQSLNFDEEFPARSTFSESMERLTLPLDIGHRMGCRPLYPWRLEVVNGERRYVDEIFGKPDAEFRRYDPDVEWVELEIIDRTGKVVQRHRITQQDPEFENGTWSIRIPDYLGLKKDFAYRWVSPSSGGPGSGIDEWNPAVPWFTNWSRHFVNPNDGRETNPHGEAEATSAKCQPLEFMRVDVQEPPSPDRAFYLSFYDENGHGLSAEGLRRRLGELPEHVANLFVAGRTYRDDQGRPFQDTEIADYLAKGFPMVDELAQHHLQDVDGIGQILMTPRRGAYNTFIDNPAALVGLEPRITPFQRGSDGEWFPAEDRAHRYNTPWGRRIEPHTGRGLFASAIEQPIFIHPEERGTGGAEIWRKQTEVTEVVQTDAAWGGSGGAKRTTVQELIDRHVPYLVSKGVDVALHTPNHSQGVNRGHRYDFPKAQGMDPSYAEWRTQTAESRRRLSDGGVRRMRRILAKQMGLEEQDGRVAQLLALKVAEHLQRGPREYLRSADAGWAQYVGTLLANGKEAGFDLVYNHFFDAQNIYDRRAYHNWHPDPQHHYEPYDSRFGLIPAVGNPFMRGLLQYSALRAPLAYRARRLRFDFTGNFSPPITSAGDWHRRAVGERFLRRTNRMLEAFSPQTVKIAEHFDESRHVTDSAARGSGGLGFDRAIYNRTFFEGVQRNSQDKLGIVRAAGQQARRDRAIPAAIDMHSFANAIAFIHDAFGDWGRAQHELGGIDLFKVEGTLLTNAEDHVRDPFPSDPARSIARAYYAATMLLPGWVSTRRGPLDRNYGHDGAVAGSDSGQLQWELPWRGRAGFDLSRVELSERTAPRFLQLASLPLDHRREASAQMVAEQREVVEFLAGLPEWERPSALVAIVQSQHQRLERDVIALRKSDPAFSAQRFLQRVDKPLDHRPQTTLQFLRSGDERDYLVILSLHPHDITDYFVDYAPHFGVVLDTSDPGYGGSGSGNYPRVFHGGSNVRIPAWSTVVLKSLKDGEA